MTLELQKPWSEVKDKMKEHNPLLTDEDLVLQEGQHDELIDRLSNKMNRSKQEIKEWIESLSFNR